MRFCHFICLDILKFSTLESVLQSLTYFLAATFLRVVVFLGSFSVRRARACSLVNVVTSVSLGSSTLDLPLMRVKRPQRAFSIRIVPSSHSFTTFSDSFLSLSSMSSCTSCWER